MAEEFGYYSVLFTDHYLGPGSAMTEANHVPQPLASVPSAVLSALVTTTLHVGFRVLCIDYHNPVVLAKELATLDQISGGRLEVGLGAGWVKSEYEAMGVQFDTAGKRIARLGAVVSLLRSAFRSEQVDVDAAGVRAFGFTALPTPVRAEGPPIAVGGGGPKILSLAGATADIVAFNINHGGGRLDGRGAELATAEITDERVAWVCEAAADAGRETPTLEIGITASAIGSDDIEAATMPFRDAYRMPPAAIVEHPHALIGSVDAICDRLVERRERYGFSYITIRDRVMESFAPVVARLAGR
jgi:probable F420-dependent oxidoreductase